MTNYIISGRLAGSKIKYQNGELMYKTNHYSAIVDNTLVQSITCIATEENKSFISSFLRGYFGRMLGTTAWLSALQSARSNRIYTLKVKYWDNSVSLVLVTYKMYLKFMEKF